MRKLLLAGAAVMLASAPVAVSAQEVPGSTASVNDQQGYDALTEEQRAEYDAWPQDRQNYLWTLTPSQQEAYWLLTDDQRMRIQNMTPEQRTAAWQSIEAQLSQVPGQVGATAGSSGTAGASTATDGAGSGMAGSSASPGAAQGSDRAMTGSGGAMSGAGAAASPAASPTGAMGRAGNTRTTFESNPVVQQTPDAQVPSEYPVCGGEIQDSCINPRAAN